MDFLFSGRAGAARFLLPLTLVAALSAGAALAQDDVEDPGEEPGVSEPGDPGEDGGEPGDGGEWEDDPIAWNEPPVDPEDPDVYLYDGEDGVPVSDCDGCEAWTTGGDRPVMENARGETAALPNPRGKDGGGCSADGFIPLPFRCDW